MAYFDSPKNRAIWEAELNGLRKQKADFASGRLPEQAPVKSGPVLGEEHRKPVTYEQLAKEEEAASKRKARPESKERGMEHSAEKRAEVKSPEAKKPVLRKPDPGNGR